MWKRWEPYYLIDQDCEEFIELMKLHGVEMTQLDEDMTLSGEDYQHLGYSPTPAAEQLWMEGREKHMRGIIRHW